MCTLLTRRLLGNHFICLLSLLQVEEKENCEEKTDEDEEEIVEGDEDEEDISERDELNLNTPKDNEPSAANAKVRKKAARGRGNRMSKLFYGQVLIEGFVRGKEFSRREAFGQWPLQVIRLRSYHIEKIYKFECSLQFTFFIDFSIDL